MCDPPTHILGRAESGRSSREPPLAHGALDRTTSFQFPSRVSRSTRARACMCTRAVAASQLLQCSFGSAAYTPNMKRGIWPRPAPRSRCSVPSFRLTQARARTGEAKAEESDTRRTGRAGTSGLVAGARRDSAHWNRLAPAATIQWPARLNGARAPLAACHRGSAVDDFKAHRA